MSWIKVAWINPMFAAFNTIAPNRAKDSDGTVGDLAHTTSPSGHNPDDTPGSRPEREDADNIAEVRAADVTTDLRQPGVTMEQVVQSVLATPAERDRLIYIIFNRRIWRKSNGWRQETYTGSDPHDRHAHFSGDPNSDNDGGPWNSITKGADVAFTTDEERQIVNAAQTILFNLRGWTLDEIDRSTKADNADVVRDLAEASRDASTGAQIAAIKDDVAEIKANMSTANVNTSTGNIDVAALAAALAPALVADPAFRQALVDAANEAEDS
jgi:hypothetical protein